MSKLQQHLQNRVEILSKNKLPKITRSKSRSPHIAGVISLVDIDKKPPSIGSRSIPIYNLFFDDDKDPTLPTAPTKKDIEQLINAGQVILSRLTEDKFIICSCEAGRCRSSAAAYILWCIMLGEGNEVQAIENVFQTQPASKPNLLMIKYADEILERNGRMLNTLITYSEER